MKIPRVPSRAFVRALALALLAGTALMAVGAGLHPVLRGSAADHLRTIAAMPGWRAIHLAMLAGTGLIITGLWVRLVIVPRELSLVLLAALAVIAIGLAVNALNIAYMAGAGLHLAERFAAGESAPPAIYDATHPIGLMAARFGNLLIALGALGLGWAEWADQSTPRFFALLAWIAAAGGLLGVALFSESSPFALAAVALLSGWQVVVAVHAFRHPASYTEVRAAA